MTGIALSRQLAPSLGSLGAGVLLAQDDPETRKWAPVAAVAGQAPTLLDEGLASGKALLAMRRMGIQGPAMTAAMKNLGKGFGSYGLAAAGAAGGTYLTDKLLSKME